MKPLAPVIAALLLSVTPAFAGPVATGTSAVGDVLTAENGMTLYTFAKDAAGVSNCYDDCATKWPPYLVDEDLKVDGKLSIIERKDDTYQLAQDGMPLYFWMNDKAAGDATGDGMGGVWAVARP